MRTNPSLNTSTPTPRLSRTRQLFAGIGALSLVGLGVAHTMTNAAGFVQESEPSWPLFLVFGVGISVALWAISIVVWRSARRGGGRVAQAIIAALGVLCCLMALNVLRAHPEILLSPAGPGLWTLIAGPSLLTTALLPLRWRSA